LVSIWFWCPSTKSHRTKPIRHVRQHAIYQQHASVQKTFFQIPRMLGRRASCGEVELIGRPPRWEGGHKKELQPGLGEYCGRILCACVSFVRVEYGCVYRNVRRFGRGASAPPGRATLRAGGVSPARTCDASGGGRQPRQNVRRWRSGCQASL
jgi:hypothetical protein